MREFALDRTSVLLRRLAYQAGRTSKQSEPDAVHDLRVAIRRLSQCLKLFAEFYPEGEGKKLRRKLKAVLRAASGVRDRDVALSLLNEARLPVSAALVRELTKEREEADRGLSEALEQWARRSFYRKCRSRLGL